MSALRRLFSFERLLRDEPSWQLLRADHAPLIVALLSEHLGDTVRRLPVEELHELIDDDLHELRAQGHDFPQTAKAYCTEWRVAGYLIRRPAEESRGETYELAPATLAAARYLEQLASPRQTVTQSRLSNITGQLAQLATDTDPNETRRLEQLHAQRAAIDEQIERIHSGDVPVLPPDRAIERVRDILAQASEIPSEFARVRASFEGLNSALRAKIIESDETQRAVLDDVFRGVNLIDESDEGRSFAGFSMLLLDPEVGAVFDDDIERVLARDFSGQLSAVERRFLRQFIQTLKEHSGEIHDVITSFARGLRRYVQSQDYVSDRVLRGLLQEALAAGVPAASQIKPYEQAGINLELSAVALSSVGSVRLYDPSELDASAPIVRHEPQVADIEALRLLARETEIDFAELTANINDLLSEVTSCTVAEVFDRFPATQGVASVVGMLSLGANQGEMLDQTEVLAWRGIDDTERSATVPAFRFTRRVL